MGNDSFKKGVEDGKEGNTPTPPPDSNSVADYIFQTHRSDDKIKEDSDDYKRGYEAGSNQSSKDKK